MDIKLSDITNQKVKDIDGFPYWRNGEFCFMAFRVTLEDDSKLFLLGEHIVGFDKIQQQKIKEYL